VVDKVHNQPRAKLYETTVWIIEMKRLLLVILLALPLSAFAEGWTDPYGYPLPNTENKKTIAGFSGWLLITSDPDWKEKFDSAESVLPQLTTVNEIGLGEKITILTLYKNPQIDTENRIDLTCDLKITRPDGTLSSDETDLTCASEELIGPADNIRRTYLVIDFIAELKDLYGVWTIEIILKDRNAKIEIPLKERFALVSRATLT
jgi:hypothetical protein